MLLETMENGVYKCFDEDKVLLTITILGNNRYRAINSSFDITAEIVPFNDYSNITRCIEYLRADKNGEYKKSTKLLKQTMSWFDYILEEKGFIRRKKAQIVF